jgi:hypothetical protein
VGPGFESLRVYKFKVAIKIICCTLSSAGRAIDS